MKRSSNALPPTPSRALTTPIASTFYVTRSALAPPELGCDTYLQEWIGHSDLTTTQIYTDYAHIYAHCM